MAKSKKERAVEIYRRLHGSTSRQAIIFEIRKELGVSEAYAATLFAGAKKAVSGPTKGTKGPGSPTVTKPSQRGYRQPPAVFEKFTPAICADIDNDVKDALKEVEAKWGITFSIGGGTYSPAKFNTKLVAHLGTAVDVDRTEWNRYCMLYGAKPEDYGRTFNSNGTMFTICGIKPRSKKFPIIGKNAKGTRYKFRSDVIERLI